MIIGSLTRVSKTNPGTSGHVTDTQYFNPTGPKYYVLRCQFILFLFRNLSNTQTDMDKIILKNLKFDLAVGFDAWRRYGKPQPVSVNLEIHPRSNFEAAAAQDDVSLSLDYGKLYKSIAATLANSGPHQTIHVLIDQLAQLMPEYAFLDIDILFPKALLQVNGGLLYRLQVDNSTLGVMTPSLTLDVKGIACSCIIGVNPHERLYKQSLSMDISFPVITTALGPEPTETHYTAELHDMVDEIIEVYSNTLRHIPIR